MTYCKGSFWRLWALLARLQSLIYFWFPKLVWYNLSSIYDLKNKASQSASIINFLFLKWSSQRYGYRYLLAICLYYVLNVYYKSFIFRTQNLTSLLGKLEAYSVLESMYLWLHITWITKESSHRRVLGQYLSLGRF